MTGVAAAMDRESATGVAAAVDQEGTRAECGGSSDFRGVTVTD